MTSPLMTIFVRLPALPTVRPPIVLAILARSSVYAELKLALDGLMTSVPAPE